MTKGNTMTDTTPKAKNPTPTETPAETKTSGGSRAGRRTVDTVHVVFRKDTGELVGVYADKTNALEAAVTGENLGYEGRTWADA